MTIATLLFQSAVITYEAKNLERIRVYSRDTRAKFSFQTLSEFIAYCVRINSNNIPMEISPQFKSSFTPIAERETRILILGSLPGEKSLQMQQYYAHPRNRFWRVIAAVTNSDLPSDYEGKLKLLRQNNIGVWDVVHSAKRIGSLDTNILEEVPNNLDEFISKHKNLKIIAFNGSKSSKLFDKYFTRKPKLKYLALPSTSPANASFTFEKLSEKWKEILL